MYAATTTVFATNQDIRDIARRFDCSNEVADAIRTAAIFMQRTGLLGKYPSNFHRRHDRAAFEDIASASLFGGVDKSDLGQLLEEAWLEGISAKDRLVVHMDSTNCDCDCADCEATLCNGSTECDSCGGNVIVHHVDLTVEGPFVRQWVDAEPFIYGQSWSVEGNDYATARLPIRVGLAEELEEDGYVLDQTLYAEPEGD